MKGPTLMPNAVIIAQQVRTQRDALNTVREALRSLSDARSTIMEALAEDNPSPDVFYGSISEYRFRLTKGRSDPHRFNVNCDFGLRLSMAVTNQELGALMETTDEDEKEADSVGMFLNGKHVKIVLNEVNRYIPQRFVTPVGYSDYYERDLYLGEPVYPRGYDRDRIGMIVTPYLDGDDQLEVSFEDQDSNSFIAPDALVRMDI